MSCRCASPGYYQHLVGCGEGGSRWVPRFDRIKMVVGSWPPVSIAIGLVACWKTSATKNPTTNKRIVAQRATTTRCVISSCRCSSAMSGPRCVAAGRRAPGLFSGILSSRRRVGGSAGSPERGTVGRSSGRMKDRGTVGSVADGPPGSGGEVAPGCPLLFG